MRHNFLIVSESGEVRESLSARLRNQGYTVTLAESGAEAVKVVRSVSVDAVLIESRQADAPAKRLRKRILRERPGCRVVLVTSFASVRNSTDLLRFGAEDYLLSVDELFNLIGPPAEAAGERGRSPVAERGIRALAEVLDVLVGLLELGDRYFGGSSHQAMRLARAVAEEMGVEEEVIYEVVIATLLRDIGKAGIDHEVLSEKGEFSDEQMDRMQEHAAASVRLLEHIDFPWKILPVIRHHHERYDGKGYPDGLKGREISIGARIVSVVDAYMAMVSDRPHRSALSPQEALEEIERQAGAQFDPEVVEILFRVVEKQDARVRSLQKPLVLLADPQEGFCRLLKMRLLNEGFEVQAVATLDQARKSLLENAPDLALVGVGSEGAAAFELLREAREHKSLRHVPFAFLAQRDDRILKRRALRQGVDDFLLKTDNLEELVARVQNIMTREATRRSGSPGPRRRGITGRIENLALPDIVQTLAIGMKTASVSLSSDRRKGKIWFRDGRIVHAKCGVQEGEQAFYKMLRWKTGEFVIAHGVKTNKATVENDPMFLVMEGLRLIDEGAADEKEATAS